MTRREETDCPSSLTVACSRDVQSQQVKSSWAVGRGNGGTAVLPSGRFFQLLKIVSETRVPHSSHAGLDSPQFAGTGTRPGSQCAAGGMQ